MLTETSLPIFTKPFEVRKDKQTIKLNKLPLFTIESIINGEEELKNNMSKTKNIRFFYKTVILDDTGDNVIGLIDTFGYFIPLYPVSYKDKDVNRFVETKNIKSKNYIS